MKSEDGPYLFLDESGLPTNETGTAVMAGIMFDGSREKMNNKWKQAMEERNWSVNEKGKNKGKKALEIKEKRDFLGQFLLDNKILLVCLTTPADRAGLKALSNLYEERQNKEWREEIGPMKGPKAIWIYQWIFVMLEASIQSVWFFRKKHFDIAVFADQKSGISDKPNVASWIQTELIPMLNDSILDVLSPFKTTTVRVGSFNPSMGDLKNINDPQRRNIYKKVDHMPLKHLTDWAAALCFKSHRNKDENDHDCKIIFDNLRKDQEIKIPTVCHDVILELIQNPTQLFKSSKK